MGRWRSDNGDLGVEGMVMLVAGFRRRMNTNEWQGKKKRRKWWIRRLVEMMNLIGESEVMVDTMGEKMGDEDG